MSFPVVFTFFQRSFSRSWLEKKDVEDALQQLDRLMQEVARMARAEVLKITRRIDNDLDDKVVNRELQEIAHSSQQSASDTKPGHESPEGGGVLSYGRPVSAAVYTENDILDI
jgi:hypothetical protein